MSLKIGKSQSIKLRMLHIGANHNNPKKALKVPNYTGSFQSVTAKENEVLEWDFILRGKKRVPKEFDSIINGLSRQD
ncbi:hypothetical protein FGG08_007457 [Glutinoglossum americanum]|uniref:Uncharacterized protein n=1 Tax=Glutinoglossum americanum TaxID=1670608 RepID=A0A9P8HZE6_9PEZI|nr:hypothetical protein FGG08_007457 [Glutinoglossum americanum]